jgi:hypothetical protein
VWNGCSTVVRWWFRVGVWGFQTLTIASAGDRTSTATRRSVPTRRPPQYRDSYDTADRDRDSTATRSGAHGIFDRNRDRDSISTAPRPPQPLDFSQHRSKFSAPPTPASLARFSRAEFEVKSHATRSYKDFRYSYTSHRRQARHPFRPILEPRSDAICWRPAPNRVRATARTDSQAESPAVGEVWGRLRLPGFEPTDASSGDDPRDVILRKVRVGLKGAGGLVREPNRAGPEVPPATGAERR